MKHYLIYKITNLINNKIYIGQHITENINDDYFGSGKLVINAIKKYGIDKFKKEILYDFDNFEQMNEMEKEIVDEEFVLRNDTYNLSLGGTGKGFWYINKNKLNHTGNQGLVFTNTVTVKLKNSKNNNWFLISTQEYQKNKYKYDTPGTNKITCRDNYNNIFIVNKNDYRYKSEKLFNLFKNHKHTEKSKRKISEKNSIHQKGEKNSQYGTCWIYNLNKKISKKIKKEDLNIWLKKGWLKGRKIRFKK